MIAHPEEECPYCPWEEQGAFDCRIYWHLATLLCWLVLFLSSTNWTDEMNNNEPLVLINVVLIVAIIMRVRVDV